MKAKPKLTKADIDHLKKGGRVLFVRGDAHSRWQIYSLKKDSINSLFDGFVSKSDAESNAKMVIAFSEDRPYLLT